MNTDELHQIAQLVVDMLEQRQTFASTFDKARAARYLHCSVSTLELKMKAKEIPFTRVGRSTVFRRIDLDQYLASKQSTSLDKILDGMIGRQKVSRQKVQRD